MICRFEVVWGLAGYLDGVVMSGIRLDLWWVFFSRAEKNQKAKGRVEWRTVGDCGRDGAGRRNSRRSDIRRPDRPAVAALPAILQCALPCGCVSGGVDGGVLEGCDLEGCDLSV